MYSSQEQSGGGGGVGLSVDEYWFSQDSRTSRPHKRRLAKSRLILTSNNDDQVNDIPSPLERPSHSSPHLHKANKSKISRKISYNYAVEDASLLPSPVSSVGLLDDEPFSHQGLHSTGHTVLTSSPHHKYHQQTRPKLSSHPAPRPSGGRPLGYSEVHRRHRYSINDSRPPTTEIVGPSSGNWNNSSIPGSRGPRRSVPESAL